MQGNFRRSLKFRMHSYLENFQRESFSQRFEIYFSKTRMPIHSFVCEIWIDIYLDVFENRHPTANSHSLCLKYSIIAFVETSVMLSVGQSDACK
ncbi:hypothetical protein C0J52_06110 [Blattella germanica]|nr:hypothetical protein C0J52_06110 [Blattella germanica]